MRKLSYTQKQKKCIIILIIINFVALTVNLFGIKGNIIGGGIGSGDKTNINIFTNSKGFSYDTLAIQYETSFKSNTKHFWPFVEYTSDNNFTGYIFKGIFSYYDFTEFIFYMILILCIPLLLNFFKKTS